MEQALMRYKDQFPTKKFRKAKIAVKHLNNTINVQKLTYDLIKEKSVTNKWAYRWNDKVWQIAREKGNKMVDYVRDIGWEKIKNNVSEDCSPIEAAIKIKEKIDQFEKLISKDYTFNATVEKLTNKIGKFFDSIIDYYTASGRN